MLSCPRCVVVVIFGEDVCCLAPWCVCMCLVLYGLSCGCHLLLVLMVEGMSVVVNVMLSQTSVIRWLSYVVWEFLLYG